MSIDDTIFEITAELESNAPDALSNWGDLMEYISAMETSHDVLVVENRVLKQAIRIVGQQPDPRISGMIRKPGATNIPEHHQAPGEPDLGDHS